MAIPTTFNFTIDDTSPQIVYSPSTLVNTPTNVGLPVIQSSWLQYFNNTGFSTVPGQLGSGESLHVTGLDNASLSIFFTGTGIQLFGLSLLQSSYDIFIDGVQSIPAFPPPTNQTEDPAEGLLAAVAGLNQTNHLITLVVHVNTTTAGSQSESTGKTDIPALDASQISFVSTDVGVLVFDRAVVTSSTNLTDAGISNRSIADTEMQFTGSWTFLTDPTLVPDGNHTYHLTQVQGDHVSYSFLGGSSVSVFGFLNDTSGAYDVSLITDNNTILTQQRFNASSSFLTPTTLFYASGLNTSTQHTLTIRNVEAKSLALTGMNITKVEGGNPLPTFSPASTTSSGLSRGALAALIVAGALGLLLILCFISFLFWRHRRKKHPTASSLWRSSPSFSPYTPGHVPRDIIDIGSGMSSVRSYGVPYTLEPDHGSPERGGDGSDESGYSREDQKSKSSIIGLDEALAPSPGTPPTQYATRARSLGRSILSISPPSPVAQQLQIVSPLPTRVLPRVSSLTRALRREASTGDSRSSNILPESISEVTSRSNWRYSTPKEEIPDEGGSNTPDRDRPLPEIPQVNVTGTASNSPRETHLSFLDFASSANSSTHAKGQTTKPETNSNSGSNSNTSRSRNKRSSGARSRRTNRTSRSSSLPAALEAIGSGTIRSGSSLMLETNLASGRHPYAASELQIPQETSPTESLPMTVSDIAFRVDDDFTDNGHDRRGSNLLPPHPPLPRSASPSTTTFSQNRALSMFSIDPSRQPHIARMLLGRHQTQSPQSQSQRSTTGAEISPPQSAPAESTVHSRQGSGTSSSAGLRLMGFGRRAQ